MKNLELSIKKLKNNYARKRNAPFYQKEFGFYCLERWYSEGLDRNADLSQEFGYDDNAVYNLSQLGWTTPPFAPAFEEKLIEDRGDHEVIQDTAGRYVIYFKGRRTGFMPEYIDHPVKDKKTWEENVKWRLDPNNSCREQYISSICNTQVIKESAAKGMFIVQRLIGGYMYLRALLGPEKLLYTFYDMPDLIHDCMKTWLNIAVASAQKITQYVDADELFLAEDICYNVGPLIGPDTCKEFLFPYYQEFLKQYKNNRQNKDKHLFIQVDTDGNAPSVIDLYREQIGMDVMSPFEVASGCDVVQIGEKYPYLVLSGGIDKRILATDKKTIEKYLQVILPKMRQRGGYIPTCDHGVPEEVSLENYRFYRKLCLEIGN
jgi:uroporphyrinogen decarboxylase